MSRMALILAAPIVCGAVTGLAREDERAVLERAREYLARYERELVTLVGDERYVQSSLHSSRVLDSEFAWVTIPTLGETIGVREVLRVDGQPVIARPRLRLLLERPPAEPAREFAAILAESATHNIGDVERNINFPTFALAYLRSRENDGSTRWRIETSGDRAELGFEERGRTTVIRSSRGGRSPARGSFLVQAETGRILLSSLTVPVVTGGSKREYQLDVDFAEDDRLGVWVPVRMRERCSSSGLVEIAGEATYTNYRRFETRGRVVQ